MRKQSKRDPNRIEQTAYDVVRDFFNVGKVKRLFRLGGQLFEAAHPFIERQTPMNAVKSAVMVGKVLVDDLEVWPDDYFDESWESPYPADFNKIILGALANKPYSIIHTSDEALVIYMVQFEDVKFGYVINTKTNFVDRVCVQADKLERAKQLIKAELWKMMKDDNIVLRNVRRTRSSYDNESVTLEVDDAFRPMPSKRASEYASYLKRCIDADVSRSVMLYGPPGTGKSTMARTIIDNLGMKSFRIRVEDIGHIETSTVFEAINIFEPDAVILDDFDRSDSQASLLETLEFFQRHVKLVIATVNNKNRLDEAIMRPGRFDELLQIKQMDDDVVKAVLGDAHADAYDLVKDWPIAFIQEYVKRRRFMSPEEAESSVKELASRVKRLSKYDDDDDVTVIEKVIKSGRPSKSIQDLLDERYTSGKRRRRKP
jgi:AAA+ superfamily predicted ATPase